ncbi:MAG: sodium:proton antiporter [Pseudomonadota bacterium]|nr:sodium:proton antiporter [Pseudomonadota bacterium]
MMDLSGPDLGMVLYGGAVALAVIGAIGVATATHLVRIVLAIALLEAGANLLLLLSAYRFDAIAPIIVTGREGVDSMVDPVPQAMVLTAIVIGVGIQAFAMSTVLKVHKVYATLDVRVLLKKMEQEIDAQAGVEPVSSPQAPDRAGIPGAAAKNVEF